MNCQQSDGKDRCLFSKSMHTTSTHTTCAHTCMATASLLKAERQEVANSWVRRLGSSKITEDSKGVGAWSVGKMS